MRHLTRYTPGMSVDGLVLRKADEIEVAASHGMTPQEAVASALATSVEAYIIKDRDEVVGVTGVAPWGSIYSPWLLGSDALVASPLTLVRWSRRLVLLWLARYGSLGNYVHGKNTESIKWLKWLGFAVAESVSVDFGGEPFHYFYLNY